MKPGHFPKTPCVLRPQHLSHREAAAFTADAPPAPYPPADARQITIRAVRSVWETMLGLDVAAPGDLPERLPGDLVRFAAAKGSLGAVMSALDRWGCSDRLQQGEKEKARLTLAKTAMATMAMRKELGLILSECAGQGIDIVVFKGHDLIGSCYRDDTVIRPVTDIDLLVRRADYPALARLLPRFGYRQAGGKHSGAWSRGGLIIDVHFEFVADLRNPASAYLPRIPSDEIFDASRKARIGGAPYRSPDPRHSLIMTALHALTHSYLMDFWFMDAGVLLIENDRPGFSDTLIELARRYRLSHVLQYHLWSIREIFGFPGDIPLSADYRVPRPVERLIRRAVSRTDYLFFGDVLLGLAIDSNKKKFYYFKEMVFPRREIVAREMGMDPRDRVGVYRARVLHLLKSGIRVLFGGRR